MKVKVGDWLTDKYNLDFLVVVIDTKSVRYPGKAFTGKVLRSLNHEIGYIYDGWGYAYEYWKNVNYMKSPLYKSLTKDVS